MVFSDAELQKPVELALEKIRPMLLRDGGNVVLLGIKEAKVYVSLEGACKGCASSANTLKFGIERCLQEEIHPDMQVVHMSPERYKELFS
ncbi:Iron-sulfur cluster assembly scaffold protein NifU [Helicobacter heilmannii]|uniref:NifU family protein n=1 Tax=Helicobacter heilmannii TaxID=35817 RepID=UPI0006A1CCEE|nr:NifU family protein [Helicobacter heilmannii]CRF51219.1 Iron-sulfur cluster assembly scaffold protein NifU [Helicobacter heilmannii]